VTSTQNAVDVTSTVTIHVTDVTSVTVRTVVLKNKLEPTRKIQICSDATVQPEHQIRTTVTVEIASGDRERMCIAVLSRQQNATHIPNRKKRLRLRSHRRAGRR